MADQGDLERFLAGARVDDAVWGLRPDYRALVIAADGLVPGPSDEASDSLLLTAESAAQRLLAGRPPEELAHVAAWRDAYRSFGAKPQRTRNSVEALLRRVPPGLPRVNRLTDIYNAVSVTHLVPCGGEDLSRYQGPPRLVRAVGSEDFATIIDGRETVEHPEPAEVVWRDDAGVTCRRWNWRQASRTQLRAETTSALFILDALAPMTDTQLDAAGDDLAAHLTRLGPEVRVARRTLTPDSTTGA